MSITHKEVHRVTFHKDPEWVAKVKVQHYSFFNLGARWRGWSTPRPGRFTPRVLVTHDKRGLKHQGNYTVLCSQRQGSCNARVPLLTSEILKRYGRLSVSRTEM
jgi:hypothetical protein